MTGMDRWIDWSKDFIGVEAARKEHDEDSAPMKLVTLEIDSADADGSEYEPVWSDGKRLCDVGGVRPRRRQEPGHGTHRP